MEGSTSLLKLLRGLLSVAVLAIVAAPSTAHAVAAPGCAPQTDPRQTKLDQDGVAQAQAGGLSLTIVRQCAGFSVVVQDSIDASAASDYASAAEKAYAHLSQETGTALSPRAVVFVFADQSSMALGESVIAGIRNATREPTAGYAWMNTVWMDESAHHNPGARAGAVSHEFSHLFSAATAKGRNIPSWFDEGLAMDSEITFPADTYPEVSRTLADDLRDALLSAASGVGSLDLYPLDELKTNNRWLQHYADPDEQQLEYAQAYATLQTAMSAHGRPAAWSVLQQMGQGVDFESAFARGIGSSVEQVDARARADWAAEVAAAPQTLALKIQIGGADASLDVLGFMGTQEVRILGQVAAGTTLHLNVGSDDTVSVLGADLETQSAALSEEESVPYTAGVRVRIRRDDGVYESLTYTRSFGRWHSSTHRYLVNPNAEPAYVALDGAMSDAFPSGDRVTSTHSPGW